MSTGDAADAVLNAEGAQYLLYRNQGIAWDGANPSPAKAVGGATGSWWERTPDPLDARYFMNVGDDGAIWYAHAPSKEFGVVMGMCL